MKLAIMQPYLFPYIGIYQLISAVDKFVVYDDVTFIKQGWINRNRILANGSPLFYTIPLSGAGSHVLIQDVRTNSTEYTNWKTKFYKTLEQNYRKAPQYKTILPLIEEVLAGSPDRIAPIAVRSLKTICKFLGIDTEFVDSASGYGNNHLKAQYRVIDICHKENADIYINVIGGAELYAREEFARNGIELAFIKSREIEYSQYNNVFIPSLSIIDVLMFNSINSVNELINSYEIL